MYLFVLAGSVSGLDKVLPHLMAVAVRATRNAKRMQSTTFSCAKWGCFDRRKVPHMRLSQCVRKQGGKHIQAWHIQVYIRY